MPDHHLPRVAIAIPTYNQADHLPVSVGSAFGQDYPNIEVWVADDASTDNTAEVLEQLQVDHPSLRVIAKPDNRGMAVNSSDALRASTSPFVVRLDSDDVLEPKYVSTLVQHMVDNPGAAYAHSAVTEIDQHGRTRIVRRLARPSGFWPANKALKASMKGHRTVSNVLMFRREALEAASYYDGGPEFTEDWDLSIRLADQGFGNVYVDVLLARYRVWTDAKGLRARRKGLQLAGFRRIYDDSILPAWRRRNWDTREVTRQRDRLAAQHCPSCFAKVFTAEEQAQLTRALLALSSGPRTQVTLLLCRLGLAHLLDRIGVAWVRAKAIIKAKAPGLGT